MATAAKETLEPLLHEKEVRALLGVSRSTLWRMGKRGVIKPIRISKNVVRYKRHDVAAFLNTGMIAMNAKPDATPGPNLTFRQYSVDIQLCIRLIGHQGCMR